MRITHGQAIEAIEIIEHLAQTAKREKANAMYLGPAVVRQIVELAEKIEANNGNQTNP